MLVDALGHEAAAEALVHAVAEALLHGQIEIAPRRREHAVEDVARDAVVLDVEEAGVLAGVLELRADRRGVAARGERGQIDNRHLVLRCRPGRFMHGNLP